MNNKEMAREMKSNWFYKELYTCENLEKIAIK